MTLIIGIGCKDGVVIAADSASTDPISQTKQPIEKIKKLREEPILYGGAGDSGLLQKIDESLEGFMHKDKLKGIRQELRLRIKPELQESIDYHVPYPQLPFNMPPEAVMLFVGVLKEEPWIVEIEKDGRDTAYGDQSGNYAAIGSGKALAQAVFRPHLSTERDLRLGKLFAYRIINDSIELAAGYLAKPIQIYTISVNGNIHRVNDKELESLAELYQLWMEMERDAVGKILARKKEEVPEPEIPKPE